IPCPRGDGARQRVECAVVPDAIGSSEHRQRKDFVVWLQRFDGGVCAPIVIDEDFVLARVLLEHLSDAPEQDANCLGFIVRRNTDVQHVAWMGRWPKSRDRTEYGPTG